ncbi:unnamed protein product [Polarella glacialis]|jgi:hypothetical protein|uniref:Uncharacterized protein n=1 Tax=Polarella glacialis TaxID=89957 RepID=A0A813IIE1_POLGL|nr:unnamed protein product [Polarella glacialis]CAE8650690.1 unnamed protein product [Polarella glacialis]
MSKGASPGVSSRMAFKNLLEFKRTQLGLAIPSPEGGFPSCFETAPELPHLAGVPITGGGQGCESGVPSRALFQRSQRRSNAITPLKIQEHIELLENLSEGVVAKGMFVEGLTCLREALGPSQA